jgi:hypothetical protein
MAACDTYNDIPGPGIGPPPIAPNSWIMILFDVEMLFYQEK